MVIPELVAGEYLHNSNSPLDQSPGNKAPRAVIGRGGVIDAVEPFGFHCFAGKIERLPRSRLHARRQFKTGHAGIEVELARMALPVLPIEAVDKFQK